MGSAAIFIKDIGKGKTLTQLRLRKPVGKPGNSPAQVLAEFLVRYATDKDLVIEIINDKVTARLI